MNKIENMEQYQWAVNKIGYFTWCTNCQCQELSLRLARTNTKRWARNQQETRY